MKVLRLLFKRLGAAVCMLGLALYAPGAWAEATSETDDQLKLGLSMFPEADANRDGILTMTEAQDYAKKKGGDGSASQSAEQSVPEKPADPSAAKPALLPNPDFEDVPYGPASRNVLDFWKAQSDKPTPVIVFIHGGGFESGDKKVIRGDKTARKFLDAGISVASLNYRFLPSAPIQDILRDCGRAIQFIRFKSAEWNVDKTRVASFGESAGAGTSLWLAFHDDLADPSNPDPVLRESTRLSCAGAIACQASYDVLAWADILGWPVTPPDPQGKVPAFYHMKTQEEVLAPEGVKIRADCDMLKLISADDPPVYLISNGNVMDVRHSPKHAEAVLRRCKEAAVPVVAKIPALKIMPEKNQPEDLKAFIFKYLQGF